MRVRIEVEELELPSGKTLTMGAEVETKDYPGLETAVYAGLASEVAGVEIRKKPLESMRTK